jgi:hypothetical protein
MSSFTVAQGQQVENPAGGVYVAGETVEMADDEARDLVRSGVLEDDDGVFDDEEWAGQVTDSSGRPVGSEAEEAAPTDRGERGAPLVEPEPEAAPAAAKRSSTRKS